MNKKRKNKITLVYLAGGLSSRFGGRIKGLQKVKGNKTLIEYSMDQALQSGFSKIVLIVGEKTEKEFKKKLKNSYKKIPIFYAMQKYNKRTRNRPWGTTDALLCAKKFLRCPFVVCNGDDIYGENSFKNLFQHLKNSNEEATVSYNLSEVLPEGGTVNRGIIKEKKGYAIDIKDNLKISRQDFATGKISRKMKCSMNIFCLHPRTLSLLGYEIKKFKKQNKNNQDAETRLPHELSALVKKNKIKIKIYPSKDRWIGITNPGDEIIARKLIKGYYKS
jgi:choline kinase